MYRYIVLLYLYRLYLNISVQTRQYKTSTASAAAQKRCPVSPETIINIQLKPDLQKLSHHHQYPIVQNLFPNFEIAMASCTVWTPASSWDIKLRIMILFNEIQYVMSHVSCFRSIKAPKLQHTITSLSIPIWTNGNFGLGTSRWNKAFPSCLILFPQDGWLPES